jgi:hypothetical protein
MREDAVNKLISMSDQTPDDGDYTVRMEDIMREKQHRKSRGPLAGLSIGLVITMAVVALGSWPDTPREVEVIAVAQDLGLSPSASDVTQPGAARVEFSLGENVTGDAGESAVFKAREATLEDAEKFASLIGEQGEVREDGLGFYGVGRLGMQQNGVFGWMDSEAYSTRTLVCASLEPGVTTSIPEGLPCVPAEDVSEYELPTKEEADKLARRILPGASLDRAFKNGPYWNLEYSYKKDGEIINSGARAEVGTSGLVSVTGVFTGFDNAGKYSYVSASEAFERLRKGEMLALIDTGAKSNTSAVDITKATLTRAVMWGEMGSLWSVPAWSFQSSEGGTFVVYAIDKKHIKAAK